MGWFCFDIDCKLWFNDFMDSSTLKQKQTQCKQCFDDKRCNKNQEIIYNKDYLRATQKYNSAL